MNSMALNEPETQSVTPQTEAAPAKGKNVPPGPLRVLAAAKRADLPPEKRLDTALELTKLGFFDEANTLIATAPQSEDMHMLTALLDRIAVGEEILARLQASGEVEAEKLMVDGHHRRSGMLIAPWPGAQRAILIFAGNGDSRFPISKNLAEIRDCHLIILRDPSRCFGLCEVPRLGKTYEANLQRLRHILRDMGTKQIFCMGLSSGGFAALKFGLDLGANGVLSFSSPTSLDINDDPNADLSKYPQLALLYRKARHLGVDLAAVYRNAVPRPEVIAVYGGAHVRDRMFAKRMEGIPGITMRPVKDYDGHTTYGESIQRGFFGSLLRRLFTLKPMRPSGESVFQ